MNLIVKIFLRAWLIIVLALNFFSLTNAQELEDESPYYVDFKSQLNLRYYFSRKYTGMTLQNKELGYDFNFMPNNTLNMGVGATYQNLTLNLAYGFGFLNPDRGRGDTWNLDLQAHAYPKKFVIDFFGQFYNGYYLQRSGHELPGGETHLVYPDMKVRKIGASVQYLFNPEQFSYRAAFLQNEWQKKSAGTFLVGFEIYGGNIRDGGGFIPRSVLERNRPNLTQISYFDFGPNLGYAYTLVIKKHFFITASVASNLGLGYTEIQKDNFTQIREWGIQPNYFLRGFVGYNSDKWSINANYVQNRVNLSGVNGYRSSLVTGNYRLNFIYRIIPGPRLRKHLRVIDRLQDKIFKD
jgi:hypothetical protein